MAQRISQIAITVRDYDEALAFYVGRLGFELRLMPARMSTPGTAPAAPAAHLGGGKRSE